MNSIKVADILSVNGFTLAHEINVWKLNNQQPFSYNDGDDAENYLLDTINASNDVSVVSEELALKIKDWPSLYHLTPKRSNLLRPFEGWFKNKRVLEVGCGCGAITRFLAEAGATIVSVEGSERRANITRARTRDMNNVTVICAPSDKIPDLGVFDAVLLIGVLEYARVFLGKDGQHDLLTFCRNKLMYNGKLFVAIENQLGLKYLAGVQEDHVGLPMTGINNNYKSDGVATFGRNELKGLLNKAGMANIEEFLPYPDYKLPTVMVSPLGWQKYYHDLSALICENLYKDPQKPLEYTFSLEQANNTVWNNKLSADLSNSFLMVASLDDSPLYDYDVAAWYYAEPRKKAMNNSKTILFKSLNGTLKVGVHISQYLNSSIDYNDFIKGGTLWSELIYIINEPNWTLTDITEWVKKWLSHLEVLQGTRFSHWSSELTTNSIDALPFNLFVHGNEGIFFDLEWSSSTNPILGYIIYRGVYHSLSRLTSVAYSSEISDYNILNITAEVLNILYRDLDYEMCIEFLKYDVEFMRINVPGDTSNIHSTFINNKLNVRFCPYIHNQKTNGLLYKENEDNKRKIEDILNSKTWRFVVHLRKMAGLIRRNN